MHWRWTSTSFAQHEKQQDRYATRGEREKIDKENALEEQFKVAWAKPERASEIETDRGGKLQRVFSYAIVGSTKSTLRREALMRRTILEHQNCDVVRVERANQQISRFAFRVFPLGAFEF